MKFACEIDNVRTLKKGSKITLSLDDKQTKELLKNMYNFMDKPITVEILVDEKEQFERLMQITDEQRRKIYAIYKDIENYTGQNHESVKEQTKLSFSKASQYSDFSLSNCSRELATEYIEYLIGLCFEMGITLSEHPAQGLEDIENYLRLCLAKGKCCICGGDGEIHHWDAIGVGRNRQKYDDSQHRKICLCRKHHTEAHQIGRDTFAEKYHVYGVKEG